MKSVNEYVIYFNPRGEQVPALAQIRRTSMELHGVEGPDCMDLIYADPTPEAVARGDLREIAKIAHSVLHFSHPKGDRSVDGPLANCWIAPDEELPPNAAVAVAVPVVATPEPGTVAGISRESATDWLQGHPEGASLSPAVMAMVQKATMDTESEPGVLVQLEAAGPAAVDPDAENAAPEGDPA